VVLLHGFRLLRVICGPPLAIVLAKDHTVIVPDARHGYVRITRIPATPKRTRRSTLPRLLDALKVQKADLVTHDIGQYGRLCVGLLNIRSGSRAGW